MVGTTTETSSGSSRAKLIIGSHQAIASARPDDARATVARSGSSSRDIESRRSQSLAPRGRTRGLSRSARTGAGFPSDALAELWAFREVLWAITVRLVKVKYKQAAIGFGWVVAQPLLSAAIFALLLGRYAKRVERRRSLSGVRAGRHDRLDLLRQRHGQRRGPSVVDNQTLLRKVYFPRESLPLGAVGAALVDLVPAFATLIVVTLLSGSCRRPPGSCCRCRF